MSNYPRITYFELDELGDYQDIVDINNGPFKKKEEWYVYEDENYNSVYSYERVYKEVVFVNYRIGIRHRDTGLSGSSTDLSDLEKSQGLFGSDLPAEIHYFPDGTISIEKYFIDGVLHRGKFDPGSNKSGLSSDLPALIYYYDNGNKFSENWYIHGKQQRLNDKPTTIKYYYNGNIKGEYWIEDNGYYRESDGPVRIEYYANGNIKGEYWSGDDGYYRESNGPVWIEYYANGNKMIEKWYDERYKHRLNGPAIIKYNNCGIVTEEKYHIHGMYYTKSEYYKIMSIVKKFINNIRRIQRNKLTIRLKQKIFNISTDIIHNLCNYVYNNYKL